MQALAWTVDCYNVQDCNGSYVPPSSSARATKPLDPPLVGVAHPDDLSDPNLTKWHKDPRNPIDIRTPAGERITRGFAGPSNLWRSPATTVNLAMELGGAVARLESTDATLHNWTVADNAFYPSGGHGGSGAEGIAFVALPALDGKGVSGWHALCGMWVGGHVGGEWCVTGIYDAAAQTFSNATAAQPLDSGGCSFPLTAACTMPVVDWSKTQAQADGRVFHLGWFNVGAGALTVPRSLAYDVTLGKILATPVAETATLRAAVLGQHSNVTLVGAELLNITDRGQSTSFDLDAQIALSGRRLAWGAALLAASREGAEVQLRVNVSAPAADGTCNVSMRVEVPQSTSAWNTSTSFLLPAGSASLSLRVLADRTMVEIFVGDGRGVVSVPVLAPGAQPARAGALLYSADESAGAAPITVLGATVWAMGCGWA